MSEQGDETVRVALEPSQLEVERVVVAALAAEPAGARRGALWVAVAAAVALIAVFVADARRERPSAGPFPVAARTEATSSVSNVGGVMLVRGMEGRTLVASTGMKRESEELQKSYRIMISKGTVP